MRIWKILFLSVIVGNFGCSSVNSTIVSRELMPSPADNSTKITVLLPISGRYAEQGKAVRDGFLAAYYIDPQDYACEINFVDSNNQNITELYQTAVANGSKLVIGPLLKSEVSELTTIPLTIPVFALNSTEDTTTKYDNLYQFGLIPQDESQQLAARVLQDEINSCLVIAPKNSNFDKYIEAFAENFTQKGGKISAVLRYNKDQRTLPHQICTFLSDNEDNLCKYSTRPKKPETANKNELPAEEQNTPEFTAPPLRQDFNGIVIFASPAEARQLIPLLKFNFAGNLPIYASSTVFDPTKNQLFNQDLDGIKFGTIPWLVKNHRWENNLLKQLQNQLTSVTSKNSPQIQQLYALGIDIYLIFTHLNELLSRVPLEGATGLINLDQKQSLHHELIWMQMKHGKTQPIKNSIDASFTTR